MNLVKSIPSVFKIAIQKIVTFIVLESAGLFLQTQAESDQKTCGKIRKSENIKVIAL
jgi:hypothetical protein